MYLIDIVNQEKAAKVVIQGMWSENTGPLQLIYIGSVMS